MDRANSGRNSALGSYETSLHDNGSRLGRCRGEPVHQIFRALAAMPLQTIVKDSARVTREEDCL